MAGRDKESAFQESLRQFNAKFPTSTNNASSSQSIQGLASNTFSKISSSVTGAASSIRERVAPTQPQEDDYFGLSWMQRMMGFGLCVLFATFCFFMSFFALPFVVAFPRKFAMTFTLGSILLLTSFIFLRGFKAHFRHVFSKERYLFTFSYVGSLVGTLYAALVAKGYILTIIFVVLQLITLVWYVGSYLPGGTQGLRYTSAVIGSQARSMLPV